MRKERIGRKGGGMGHRRTANLISRPAIFHYLSACNRACECEIRPRFIIVFYFLGLFWTRLFQKGQQEWTLAY
jgi:hypothetical protein